MSAEKKKEYNKKYREEKKDEIAEKKKEYYEEKKDEITEKRNEPFNCECGSVVIHHHKARHNRTKKHQEWLKKCIECEDEITMV